jgi:hypothetical protein
MQSVTEESVISAPLTLQLEHTLRAALGAGRPALVLLHLLAPGVGLAPPLDAAHVPFHHTSEDLLGSLALVRLLSSMRSAVIAHFRQRARECLG